MAKKRSAEDEESVLDVDYAMSEKERASRRTAVEETEPDLRLSDENLERIILKSENSPVFDWDSADAHNLLRAALMVNRTLCAWYDQNQDWTGGEFFDLTKIHLLV
jgi:hypothetical protein